MSEEGVDIGTLSPQQLQSLGETLQENLQQLGDSFQKLQGAVSRFHTSGTALEALAEQPAGKPMLVPLTQSLYAPGKLGDTGKVLIDIGTGYFVEYTPADGVAYCRRKVLLLRENVDKLGEIITVKRRQLMQVQDVLQRKMASSQGARRA